MDSTSSVIKSTTVMLLRKTRGQIEPIKVIFKKKKGKRKIPHIWPFPAYIMCFTCFQSNKMMHGVFCAV